MLRAEWRAYFCLPPPPGARLWHGIGIGAARYLCQNLMAISEKIQKGSTIGQLVACIWGHMLQVSPIII